jgi:molecular chaperone GrpE (heat shock protein)
MAPGIAGVIEGYALAIRRCDRTLAQFGVRGLRTVGASFDARTMHAVDTRRVKQQAEGVVVEEYIAGFVRDGAVLRLAEVAVNRLQAAEGAD